MSQVYDPSVLRTLIQESGLSTKKIADITGISIHTLSSYLISKPHVPSLQNLTKLADFFAVPIDFLVGRCDKEMSEKILSEYSKYFMQLRRSPYEAYLVGRTEVSDKKYNNASGEAPWPYNLLDAVFGKDQVTDLVDAEHEADIIDVVYSSARDACYATALLEYYRDGCTLSRIAEMENSAKETIRMRILKSLGDLRRSHSKKLILRYGNKIAKEIIENERNEAEIKEKEVEIEQKKKILLQEAGKIEALHKRYGQLLKKINMSCETLQKDHFVNLSTDIEDLDFSIRAYNCLKRAGCNSLADVIALVEKGELVKVRNLGRKSAEEVRVRVQEILGSNIFVIGCKI